MRLLPSLCLPILALAPGLTRPVSAQILSLYGTFSPVHVSNVRDGNSSNSSVNNGYNTTSYWTPGVGGGVTLGVLPVGPVSLGLDLRGSTKPGTNGSDLILAGIKVGAKVPLVAFKPYVQASGGYLATRTHVTVGGASATSTDHFATYEILGGVDYKLIPFFDLRLIEVGGGRGYQISGAGDTAGSYVVNLFTVNTGVVFHF